MNIISLIGRLTQDPDLKQVGEDRKVCRMRIAVNRPKTGGEDRGAAFFDLEVWGAQGETCHRYLTKGRQVAITGYLEHDEWEHDGSRRQKVYLVGRQVDFLDKPDSPDEPNVAVDENEEEIAF